VQDGEGKNPQSPNTVVGASRRDVGDAVVLLSQFLERLQGSQAPKTVVGEDMHGGGTVRAAKPPFGGGRGVKAQDDQTKASMPSGPATGTPPNRSALERAVPRYMASTATILAKLEGRR